MMQSETIQKLSEEISQNSSISCLGDYLIESHLNALATSTKFTTRKSAKLKGHHFFDLQVNYLLNSPLAEQRLEDMCPYLQDRHGLSLVKSSLDAKYNPSGVHFMQKCFESLMSVFLGEMGKGLSLGQGFSGIIVQDCTIFKLPSCLSELYGGNEGRSKVDSSLKIHYSYDLLGAAGSQTFQISSGVQSDIKMWEFLPLRKNHLYIQDLGFFSQQRYKNLIESESYFLSRYKAGVNLYLKNEGGQEVELDLEVLLADLCVSKRFIWGKKNV